jgi:hypothetical protein
MHNPELCAGCLHAPNSKSKKKKKRGGWDVEAETDIGIKPRIEKEKS